MGRVVLDCLQGRFPEQSFLIGVDTSSIQYDVRQLRRHGIDMRLLPAGATVLFQEISVWDQYRFLLKRRSMRSAFRASLSFAASVRFFAGTTRRASCIVTVEAPLTLWAFRIFCSTARTTAEKSSPQCEKKRLSSAAKKISMACCGIAESGVNSRCTPPSSASTCINVLCLS